jgi:uncharacterized protein (UPF0305 family)
MPKYNLLKIKHQDFDTLQQDSHLKSNEDLIYSLKELYAASGRWNISIFFNFSKLSLEMYANIYKAHPKHSKLDEFPRNITSAVEMDKYARKNLKYYFSDVDKKTEPHTYA